MKTALRCGLFFALGTLGAVAMAEALATRSAAPPRQSVLIWLGACSVGVSAAVYGTLRRAEPHRPGSLTPAAR